jgi:hypothetical protein
MNASRKTALSAKGQEELATLQKAVAQALDRKKRLGQYAVVWKDNKPIMIGEDAPKEFRDNRQGS